MFADLLSHGYKEAEESWQLDLGRNLPCQSQGLILGMEMAFPVKTKNVIIQIKLFFERKKTQSYHYLSNNYLDNNVAWVIQSILA